MTEQCPLCGKERPDGQDYCLTSGCGWHFAGDIRVDPQSEHSYVQSEEKWEKNKEEMQKEHEPPKSEPEFFKERDEKSSEHSFIQSESEWENDRKEMEVESESTVSDYNAQVVDSNESQGILVLPNGKEVSVDNPITIGRTDVSEYVEFTLGKNPNEISSQQFTIWRENGHCFIEDRITSVQNKPSTNGTKVNGESITGQIKKELHDGDKIEFARIEKCIAIFKTR